MHRACNEVDKIVNSKEICLLLQNCCLLAIGTILETFLGNSLMMIIDTRTLSWTSILFVASSSQRIKITKHKIPLSAPKSRQVSKY